MKSNPGLAYLLCWFALLHAAFSSAATAQEKTSPTEDVLRINTELVQTTVTVLNRDGKVVEGLRPEQFELRVNGQVQPISLFESIETGSSSEALQLLESRGRSSSVPSAVSGNEPGRNLVFFVDDLHLSLDGVDRIRQTLLRFLDNDAGPNDKVAIISTTGQLGFLQQFIENKAVIRAIVGQLRHRPYQTGGFDPGSAPMSEYMALVIERKSDDGVLRFYIRECMRRGGLSVMTCERQVINRARDILRTAAWGVTNTYDSFHNLLRTLDREPGRKLVVVVSDGFLLDTGPRNFDTSSKLKLITDEAKRAGVVVYTIHAKGLNTGMVDATNLVPMDPSGRLQSAQMAEAVASQDPLNALARDTGGRAFRNQNVFDAAVRTAFEETSKYYVLAWRPGSEKLREPKNRNVKVEVIGRPDLVVRVTDALYGRSELASNSGSNSRTVADRSPGPGTSNVAERYATLPTAVAATFLDTPQNGTVVTTSVQVEVNDAMYKETGKPVEINIGGIISDKSGKTAASFKTTAAVSRLSSNEGAAKVIYNYRAPLPPGIYRIRIAAEEPQTKTAGTATEWLLVPELPNKKLALSSLLIGLQGVGANINDQNLEHVQWSVDHRFQRGSKLRLLTFIYNARAAQSTSGLSAEVHLYKNRRRVLSLPASVVNTSNAHGDLQRIPYSTNIDLGKLETGDYLMQILVTDRSTGGTAVEQTSFHLE